MPATRLRVALLLLALVAGGAAVPLRAKEQWLVARTAHFEMFSSASEKESRRILAALEQFRANFLASFPLRGASEPRVTIVVFDSESQFRPYKPLYKGKPKEVAGYFLPAPDEVMIAMTTEGRGGDLDPEEVIFHEYVHLLLHVHEARVPLWLNEGLAELYSTFRVEGNKVEFGLAKEGHVAVLNQSAMLPLAKLFAVTHQSPDYNEESRMGIFYAQAWAFTHYLVCGEDRTNGPKLARFIERLSGSGEPEESFREAFGRDYKPVEQALRNYLSGGRYYKRTTPALLPQLELKFQPAAEADREFALLNLRWRMHHSADGAYRALELLRQHPQMPRPHELLAAIAASEGDNITAQRHWQEAADLKSDNPFVYVQLLKESLAGFQGAAFLDTRLPEDRIASLRALVGRALALSPENADAIELASLIEAMAETFDIPTINRVQGVALKLREPARTLLGLAIIRWRAGDAKTAGDIVDLILAQRRADMPTRAAADLLRSRLPGAAGAEGSTGAVVEVTPQMLAARAAVALQSGNQATAARALLDRLLAERGTLAPRMKLEPAVAMTAKGAPATDAWTQADDSRARAGMGDNEAMFELAVAHACGDGAEFSPSLAVEWLEKAARAGHAVAAVAFRPNGDVESMCRFLRTRRANETSGDLPPLDSDLSARITEAVAAAPSGKVAVIHRAAARYPAEKRRTGSGGEAVVQFRVDAGGLPQAIQVAQASDASFGASAEECVRQWRFLPTIRDGQAAATEVELTLRFQIEGTAAAPNRP